jgi:peptide/nickel transport system substrate-binding protein
MKSSHPIYESASGRILLVVLVMMLTLFCVQPADSASEPGTVTIVLNQEPPNLDPSYTIGSNVGHILTKNVVETLTEINYEDSSVTPRLATSWKRIDAVTWRFFLRKGVKFHDGADLNAEAVVFNINRLYDKKINSKIRAKLFPNLIMEGKALDSHILEIKTDKPEPLLLTLMGAMTLCSPNTPLDKFTRSPVGTGPYKFVKWEIGRASCRERV